jgi:hypothetical protein
LKNVLQRIEDEDDFEDEDDLVAARPLCLLLSRLCKRNAVPLDPASLAKVDAGLEPSLMLAGP